MQKLQHAAAVFCIACVCAEVLSQVVGAGWPRRCIKGLAGLYILAVLLQTLPDLRLSAVLPQQAERTAVSMESADAVILRQAEQQLETLLAAQCREQFGVSVQASIALRQTTEGTQAEHVVLTFPPECGEEIRQAVSACAEQLLGAVPQEMEASP